MKICEWRDMGYTQEQIAEGTGLSQNRSSKIVSEKCTKEQKTNILKKKAKKIMSTETLRPGSKGFERWPLAGRKIRGQRDVRCGSGSREIAILAAGAAFPDMMDKHSCRGEQGCLERNPQDGFPLAGIVSRYIGLCRFFPGGDTRKCFPAHLCLPDGSPGSY